MLVRNLLAGDFLDHVAVLIQQLVDFVCGNRCDRVVIAAQVVHVSFQLVRKEVANRLVAQNLFQIGVTDLNLIARRVGNLVADVGREALPFVGVADQISRLQRRSIEVLHHRRRQLLRLEQAVDTHRYNQNDDARQQRDSEQNCEKCANK